MRSSTSHLLAAALLLGSVASRAGAQDPPPLRQPFGTGELPGFLKTFDINQDGTLSVEERQGYEKALRDATPPLPGTPNPWDTDGDGKLSDAEKLAARDAIANRIAVQRSQRFDEIEIDSDGFLNAAEIAGIPHVTAEQVAMIIANLDKDADGKVSKDEFLAALKPVEGPIPPCPLPPHAPQVPIPAPAASPLSAFDTDKDGFVTPAEFTTAQAAIDANGDGMISPDEWKLYVLAHLEVLPALPESPSSE